MHMTAPLQAGGTYNLLTCLATIHRPLSPIIWVYQSDIKEELLDQADRSLAQ